jgi:Na+/H+ antiporter NhaD/arsenite permease-like protein
VALAGLFVIFAVLWLLYPAEFRAGRSSARSPSLSAPRSPTGPLPLAQAEAQVYLSTLRRSLVVIALMLIAFLAGANITVAAFIAACAVLIGRRFESARILALVDWPLLVMFSGLFVVTGALEHTDVSAWLFEQVKPLAFAGTAPLAIVTLLLSNLISNVPAVLLFRPLVPQFADPTQAWLTLAAASTLAGNLTLIGSVANLIVAEQARKFGIALTFRAYLLPAMIVTILTMGIAVL